MKWSDIFCRRLPTDFRGRSDNLSAWVSAFGQHEEAKVKEFLQDFCDAFRIRRGEAKKLLPSDKLIAIYKFYYPSRLIGDELDVENLALILEKKHGIKGWADWSDPTLGEIYAEIRRASEPGTTPTTN